MPKIELDAIEVHAILGALKAKRRECLERAQRNRAYYEERFGGREDLTESERTRVGIILHFVSDDEANAAKCAALIAKLDGQA